jgi:hypothetical protein
MILSNKEDLIVSSWGGIDKGSLWLLNTHNDSISRQDISDAKYLTVHIGKNDYFSIVHHYEADRICISAHSFKEPGKTISRVLFEPSGNSFEGDTMVWKFLPKTYVAYFKRPALSDFYLFLIEPIRPSAEIIILDWFNESYDKGYQGVIDVIEIPNQNKLIISIQRDSHPVLYDLDQRKVIAKISLADRHGNPTLRFNHQGDELWAEDYDTLLRINTSTWQVINSMRLQGASAGTGQFIGYYCFNKDESLCAVARPFSGDVVALNTKRFKITHTCTLGSQPLSVALLTDGTVYSRDWKTGNLLKGKLKKKWFA